jgi:UDP-2,4-diacetamido-2,4,6-trideoxy-beta-L-altropyranose hydrolase
MMKVGVLAATGKDIGLGHLKRCLSIATSLKKLSHNIEFIVENDYFANWIHESGFSYANINNQNTKYDLILIDKYDIDKEFLQVIRKNCNILGRIDDAFSPFKDNISDILINCNPYAEETLYTGLLKPDCHLILGKDFVPMEYKFCSLRKEYRIKNSIRNITLTFGGSENIEFVKLVCERINIKRTFSNIFVLNGTILESSLSRSAVSNLKLLPLMRNIEDIFSLSDLVICSASTTCWQLCAIGIPFICFQTADNQKYNYDYIKNTKVGVALKNDDLYNEKLEKEILDLDLYKRQKMYIRSRRLIDCRGSDRMAIRLSELINSRIFKK